LEGYKTYQKNLMIRNPEKAIEILHKKDPKAAEEARAKNLQPGKVAAIDDYRAVMAERAVFQSIASMGLPAFTIHSVVRYSGRALKDVKNVTLRTWGPIGVCLPFKLSLQTNISIAWFSSCTSTAILV
jgi:fission process protein 1